MSTIKAALVMTALLGLGAPLAAQDSAAAGTEQPRQIQVTILGMSCPFCVYEVQRKLKKLKGVSDLEVDLESGLATLTLRDGADLSNERLIEAAPYPGRRLSPTALLARQEGARRVSKRGAVSGRNRTPRGLTSSRSLSGNRERNRSALPACASHTVPPCDHSFRGGSWSLGHAHSDRVDVPLTVGHQVDSRCAFVVQTLRACPALRQLRLTSCRA